MPKIHKKNSKRILARTRYKVEKKVRAHNKKKRKEAKKNPRKSKPKDPGIPNSLPFKDKILKEVEEYKQRKEEMRKANRERQKLERQKLLGEKRDLDSLQKDAERRGQEFETKSAMKEALEKDSDKSTDPSLRAYYQEFKQVVEAADVILEVLDARDPLGTRCPQVEQAVFSSGTKKRLVLVLNKIDLIPRNNLEEWLKYLRNELPTVPFKASTQTQKENLARSRMNVLHSSTSLLQSSKCLGANMLMKVLGNYCRSQGIQTSIRVGVVGFPNVGKSSIINSLKRSRACTVGATPGLTKTVQEVQLDKHIRLLDSPGIVLAKDSSDAAAALRNAKKIECLDDPMSPAETILQRANKEQFMVHYRLPDYSSSHECLCLLAKRMGKLKKGGVPDVRTAAKKILHDWNIGRIKYYTHPPENHESSSHISADIVTAMGQEFDINSLQEEEQAELRGMPVLLPGNAIVMDSLGVMEADEGIPETSQNEENVDDEQDMETDEEASQLSEKVTVELKSTKVKPSSEKKMSEESLDEHLQQNKSRKKAFKKLKKDRKRSDKVATALSASLESAFSFSKDISDAYDFETDFI